MASNRREPCGGASGYDERAVGTAGKPCASGRRSQFHGRHSGRILACALTQRSGGRIERAACHFPKRARRKHLLARRCHTRRRLAHVVTSRSSRHITTGGTPVADSDDTGGAAAAATEASEPPVRSIPPADPTETAWAASGGPPATAGGRGLAWVSLGWLGLACACAPSSDDADDTDDTDGASCLADAAMVEVPSI